MGPDARVLVNRARKSSQAYRRVYLEDPSNLALVKEVAGVMQEFTQKGGVRPFGVSLLIAGYDKGEPSLYQVDPSGSYFPWKATAIGKNMVAAKSFLEKRYDAEMLLEDAVHTAILTLKEGFEGVMNESNIEIGIIGESTVPNPSQMPQSGFGIQHGAHFRRLSPSEVKDYLATSN
ncbi:proteasome-domain-containing protein [Neoconidiobolus thromboides FSU 785]|nr:proteasome-domain-containing protein [Neoconidiobolus thromboides FSU 785]